MTLRVTTRGAAIGLTAVLLGWWGADAVGNAIVSQPKSVEQRRDLPTPQEGTALVDSPRSVSPVTPTVRVTPTRAARSRPTSPGHDRAKTPQAAAPFRGERLSVTCYVWTGNRTASGSWPKPGTAAGNRWPFGTRLRVEGVGIVTITDRIGHSSELDLYFTSRADCLRFGRRNLLVEVVR